MKTRNTQHKQETNIYKNQLHKKIVKLKVY